MYIITYCLQFQQEKFPEDVSVMSGLRWLRLNRTGLEMVPYEVSKLTKLVSKTTSVVDHSITVSFLTGCVDQTKLNSNKANLHLEEFGQKYSDREKKLQEKQTKLESIYS